MNNITKLFLTIFLGVVIWFIPSPEGVTPQAWHLMAVFVATVVGLILSPYPLGAMAIFSLTIVVALKLVTLEDALKGFGNSTIWMIACAFFISRGFIKAGFGRRVGYLFINKLGNNTLGLSYGLVMTDLLLLRQCLPLLPDAVASSRHCSVPFRRLTILAQRKGLKIELGHF